MMMPSTATRTMRMPSYTSISTSPLVRLSPEILFAYCFEGLVCCVAAYQSPQPPLMSTLPIYALRKNEVFTALETSPEGLSAQEAQARFGLYGPNILADPKPA